MAFRLLAITDPGCPISTRYRVAQYESYLKQHGIEVETRPWPRMSAEQADLLDAVASADGVLLQRLLPARRWLAQLRRCAKRLIYDFDDAVIYAESTRGRPRLLLGRWWRFRAMMRCCDAISAGNAYLAELAQREKPPGRVCVVPTTLELARYDQELPQTVSEPIVGWIGGRWTLPYLTQLRRPLKKLSQEIPGLTVRVIADQKPDLGETRVELVPWAAATEATELKRLNAGLAPLPDDAWTRGKCGLRLLQYLAAGIPAVASPVGTQAAIIGAGAALPASSDADWVRAISRVLSEPALAAEMVAHGRQLVREQFSVAAWAERVAALWCGEESAKQTTTAS